MTNHETTRSAPCLSDRARKRKLGPSDEWSNISRLPQEAAEAVDLDRRIEVYRALPEHNLFREEGIDSGMLSALDRMRDMGPKNAIESMLVAHLTTVHAQMMDCMRRANGVSNEYPQRHGAYLDLSVRLGSLFLKQMSALDKRRGGGSQKVTVEHVHVSAGGNPIVGHVETSAPAYAHDGEGRKAAKQAHSKASRILD